MDVKSGKANSSIEVNAKIMQEQRTATPPAGNSTSVKAESQLSASAHQASLSNLLDHFETAKGSPFQSNLASHSVFQKGPTFTEQEVHGAAKAILDAARLHNQVEEINSKANEIAAALQAQAAIVSTIPVVGPILAAVLLQIAATILVLALQSSQKLSMAAEQKAAPDWTAPKKDHE
jgi:hypothetical protein